MERLNRFIDRLTRNVLPSQLPMAELRWRLQSLNHTPVLEYRVRLIGNGSDYVGLTAWGPWQAVPTIIEA